MNRILFVAAISAAALGCQRNLDMPPVPSSVALGISPAFVALAPREQTTFSGSGGAGSYTFAFAQGGRLSGPDATIDAATGVYQAGSDGSALDVVEVTDGAGRTATASISVGARLSISPLSPNATPGGILTFSANGGKPPYAFAFGFGGNGSGGTVSEAGLYTAGAVGGVMDVVVVTDATGTSATTSVGVGQGLRFYRSDTSAVAPGASVAFIALGGSPPYTFSLKTVASGAGAAIDALTGIYTAGARPDPDDGTGTVVDVLQVTDSADVPQSATYDVQVGERRRSLTPASVSLAPREQLTFVAAGGFGGYTFAFAPNGRLSGADATIDAATGLYQAGSGGSATDVIQVTDGTARTATATINVGPRVSINPLSPSTTPGGRVTFSANGGKPPYTFAFDPGGNGSGGSVSAAGAYTAGAAGPVADRVAVTDAAGATAVTTVAVAQSLRIYRSETTAVAPGASVTLIALGGKPPYAFSLQTVASGTGAAIDGTSGVYTAGSRPEPDAGVGTVTDVIRVTDSADVPQTATLSVPVGERQRTLSPAVVALAPREQQTFVPSGGSGGYTFAFAAGGQRSGADATIDPVSGLYQAGSSGSSVDVVQVTDGQGRTATASITVGARVAISPLSPSTTPGGRVTFTASGGKPPYGYAFDAGGNLSGGTVGADGSYTAGSTGSVGDRVAVTDAAGGTAVTTVAVAQALRIYRSETAPVAPGASVTLIALGGKPPYAFSLQTVASGTGAAIDALSGVYTAGDRPDPDDGIGTVTDVVQVTDSADVAQTATLSVPVGERLRALSPAFVALAPREQQTFVASGGAGGYTYAFAPAGQVSGPDATIDPVTGLYRAGSDGSALDVVQVTDGAGRTATASVSVGPRVAISPLSPSATPGGRITFTASGGKPPYGYAFAAGGNGSGGTMGADGSYTAGSVGSVGDLVEVTDAAGGTAVTTVSVGQALRIYRSETTPVAPHESVTLIALGGKPPYTFSLQSRASGASAAIDALSGVYTAGNRPDPDSGTGTVTDVVLVTDAADVPQTATLSVQVGERLRLEPPPTEVHPGEAIRLVASGGKPPYVFGFSVRVAPAVNPTRAMGGNGGNRSGGTVEPVSGEYRPGNSPGAIDFLQVTDSVGAPAAIAQGPRVGGQQVAIGSGVNGCSGLNLDGDLSGDVAFFGRASSGGGESAKIITARQLSSSSPALDTYFATHWADKIGAITVADFTNTGRDRILAFGGGYTCVKADPNDTRCSRDVWDAVPDLGGVLSLEQLMGGQPTSDMYTEIGSGYLDAGAGAWIFASDGQPPVGVSCPAGGAPWVDGRILVFDWVIGASAPSAPGCVAVPNYCRFCDATTWSRAAAMAVGDFGGDATLDLAWISSTVNNGTEASGANASVSVALGNGTDTLTTPLYGWPTGYAFVSEWNATGQPMFVVARAPSGAPAGTKDALLVRLIDPAGRPKLFLVQDPAAAATWTSPFDPNPAGAGVDGVVPLAGNGLPSGTVTQFATWSGTDGLVSGFALDWSTGTPTFHAPADPVFASFPFAVSAACVSDVNTDGARDLVAASDWGATAGVVLGDGTDALAPGSIATFGARTHQRGMEFPVAVGDLDGDGFGDAAVALAGRGLGVLWGGGGQLAWGPQVSSASIGTATIGDFTGDGKASIFYQEKGGTFGRIAFAGGGSDAYTVTANIPGVNASNTGPAGSYILLWPADLGTSATPGGDALSFTGGDGTAMSALLVQTGVVVDVKAALVTPPANHRQRDGSPAVVGGGAPAGMAAVAYATSFRLNGPGDPVDSIVIYGTTLSNANGAPGTAGAPAFADWTAVSPDLGAGGIGSTAIWSPAGVSEATIAPAGTVPAGAGGSPAPGTALFVMNTDRLYVVEVSGHWTGSTWIWHPPAIYPVGPTPATGRPFLATMGRLDATSDLHIAAWENEGMLVIRRTGGASPTYTLIQRLSAPLLPIGFAKLADGSPGDLVGFLGNFDGMGVVPELVPLLNVNDGSGKVR